MWSNEITLLTYCQNYNYETNVNYVNDTSEYIIYIYSLNTTINFFILDENFKIKTMGQPNNTCYISKEINNCENKVSSSIFYSKNRGNYTLMAKCEYSDSYVDYMLDIEGECIPVTQFEDFEIQTPISMTTSLTQTITSINDFNIIPTTNLFSTIPTNKTLKTIPITNTLTTTPITNTLTTITLTNIPIINTLTTILITNILTTIPITNTLTTIPIINILTTIPIKNLTTIPITITLTIITMTNTLTTIPITNSLATIPIINLTTIPITNTITIITITNTLTTIPIINSIATMIITSILTTNLSINTLTDIPTINTLTIIPSIISSNLSFLSSTEFSQDFINSSILNSLSISSSLISSNLFNYIDFYEEGDIIKGKINITKKEIENNLEDIMNKIKLSQKYKIYGIDYNLTISSINYINSFNSSHIEFYECEKILREKYNLTSEELLTIV